MTWQQRSPYCLEHCSGARVAKLSRGPGPDGRLRYRYLAYGPDRAAGWSYRAYSNGSAKHWSGQEPPIRTQLGQRIEQRHPLLGAFDTAAEAKATIEAQLQLKDHLPDTGKKVSNPEPSA